VSHPSEIVRWSVLRGGLVALALGIGSPSAGIGLNAPGPRTTLPVRAVFDAPQI
jgi:hypothetical protein